MHILRFMYKGGARVIRHIALMVGISGLANAFLLAIVNNSSAIAASAENVRTHQFILFLIAFAIYALCNKIAQSEANVIAEKMLKELRIRILDKIRKSRLLVVDSLGRGELYTRLSQELNRISEMLPYFVSAVQQLIFLVFCLVYIATLSITAFLGITFVCAAGILIFFRFKKSLDDEINNSTAKESELVDNISHIIDGFKEIRINNRKSDSIFNAFRRVAGQNEILKLSLGSKYVFIALYSSFFLYSLLGIIVFVFPQYIAGYKDVVIKLTATTLFLMSPLSFLVTFIPLFSRANITIENLDKMEKQLGDRQPDKGEEQPDYESLFKDFRKISLNAVTFSYTDSQGLPVFTTGPVDMHINRGEILFIVGGNGSGKSTLLKLITGLYTPGAGVITVDNIQIDQNNLQGLSELYSCIFSDFHLFDRLYGLENIKAEEAEHLIEEMGLKDKLTYKDGRFSNLNLSTGQRKRLALITSLLEDKSIYIFDEWASDQDSHFREFFYDTILKDLSKKGKTIIAVTHDDRYWGTADRILKMELGRVIEEKTNPPRNNISKDKEQKG
ncbi:MAG: cyclic peptide export ABC transporter [Candidatus Xenobiia bacterium LiM19]